MDLGVLRECYHLSQSLSFTDTARHFYIAQSALSRHISNLEHELGTTLFMRSKNGVHLTQAGRVFIADVEKVLAAYETALNNLNAFQQGVDRTIQVGYLFGAASSFLAEAIVGFNKRFPSVSIAPKTMEIDEIIGALDENRIDMAITTGVWKFSEDRFNEQNLYLDGSSLLLPLGHPLVKELAGRDSISIDELRGRSDVAVPAGGVGNHETGEFWRQVNLEGTAAPSLTLGSPDILSIKVNTLSSGLGLIIYSHIENVYGGDDFVMIPIDTPLPPFYVRAVWKKSQESKALLAFVEELTKASKGFVIGSAKSAI